VAELVILRRCHRVEDKAATVELNDHRELLAVTVPKSSYPPSAYNCSMVADGRVQLRRDRHSQAGPQGLAHACSSAPGEGAAQRWPVTACSSVTPCACELELRRNQRACSFTAVGFRVQLCRDRHAQSGTCWLSEAA
jgi:hypothetical protein